jgi:hypothetical protein
MISQVRCTDAEHQALAGVQGAPLRDAISDVDEARQREGKRRVDHQRHRQWEREQVRIGGRQSVGLPKATYVRVARQMVPGDVDVRQFNRDVGQAVAMTAAGTGDRFRVKAP